MIPGNTMSDIPKNNNNDQPQIQQLEGEELKLALKRQVEFYFSRQNLAHDSYLLSQMGPQMFVPISVLVQFSKVKELTADTALVANALKDSKVCTLNEDGTAVRPNIKTERNTIILREIPSETPTEEVQAIFGNSSAVTGVRSDVGDTWFVTMETEDDAVKTLLELRSKTFQDKPIKARLKSENLVRSFYPAVVTDVNAAVSQAPSTYYGQQQQSMYHTQNPYNPARMYQGAIPYGNMEGGRYNGRNGSRNGGARNGGYQQRAHNNNLKDGRKGGSQRKGKDKKGFKGQEKRGVERQPILNAANFPPLPTSGEKAATEPGAGYSSDEYVKYAHDDIMEIVKNMSEEQCQLENGRIDFAAHSAALSEEANPDLLRNQRTYSIDQAREALRQGRPIRSDSIGSIDYESMIYGEEYTKEARQARASVSSKTSSPNKSGDEVSSKTLSVESDVASESSSSKIAEPQQEPQPKKSGYAAALLNGTPAPPAPVAPVSRSKVSGDKKDEKKSSAKNGPKKSKVEAVKEENQVVCVEPVKEVVVSESAPVAAAAGEPAMSAGAWGEGKRSFLDVLKTKNEAVVPVASNQIENQPQKKLSAGASCQHHDNHSGREKERRNRHGRESRRSDKHERADDRSKHEPKTEKVATSQVAEE